MILLATCCGNCRSGKPCCGGTKRRRRPRPAFVKRGPLWLPKPGIVSPRALVRWPSEPEWGGLWRPWLPAQSATYDLSCLPCCGTCCEEFGAEFEMEIGIGSGTHDIADMPISPVIGTWNGSGPICVTTTYQKISEPAEVTDWTICVWCSNGAWTASIDLDCNFPDDPTYVEFPLDLVSCDPFLLTGTFELHTACFDTNDGTATVQPEA